MQPCWPHNSTVSSDQLESSCCVDFTTSSDKFYRAAQALHVITGVLGVYFSVLYITRYSAKHLLPKNTKVFTSITLAAIVVHSIDLTALHIFHLFQSFRASESNPCYVQNTVGFCAPFRYTFSFCVFLMVLNQYFMYIDRALDTLWVSYRTSQKYVLTALLITEVPLTAGLILFMYRHADPTEKQLSCLNAPPSSLTDVSLTTAAILPINCLCLLMSILLFQKHQRKAMKTRFNVTRSFKASMNRDAMSFLRYTTATQAIIIVIYPIVVLAVRLTSTVMHPTLNKTLATLAYIFNWYCVLVPVAMIYAVKRYRTKRQRKINSVLGQPVAGEQGSDYYFQLLKDQWEQQETEAKA